MSHQPLPTGKRGEQIARTFLSQKGFLYITSNFHSRFGEIDLIMQDGLVLVFIEVKTRSDDSLATPQEAVTLWKIQKIIKTAEYFKLLHPKLPEALRIDVVAVTLELSGEVIKIEHIENVTG